MLDLREGIAELFEEAQARADMHAWSAYAEDGAISFTRLRSRPAQQRQHEYASNAAYRRRKKEADPAWYAARIQKESARQMARYASDPEYRALRNAQSREYRKARYARDEAYREKRKAKARKDRAK